MSSGAIFVPRIAASPDADPEPRLFPIPGLEPARWLSAELPGRVQLIVDGQRVVVNADGSAAAAPDWLPLGRELTVLPLPVRLGGGYAFAFRSQDDVHLYRTKEFLGRLQPVGRFDVPAQDVAVGFEGLLLTVRDTGLVVAVDPQTGRATENPRLPPAPEYGPIQVVDDWFGAVVDPLRGVLVSFDAGGSYQATGLYAKSLAVESNRLRVSDGRDRAFVVDSQGGITLCQSGDWVSTPDENQLRLLRWKTQQQGHPLGDWPLQRAIEMGATVDDRVAWVLSGGRLAGVDMSSGRVLAMQLVPGIGSRPCPATALRDQVLFACSEPGRTTLLMLSRQGEWRRLVELMGNRRTLSTTHDGIVLSGACEGSEPAPPAYATAVCRVDPSGSLRSFELGAETNRIPMATGNEPGLVVIVPPRPGRPGRLRWPGTGRKDTPLAVLSDDSPAIQHVLVHGRWLTAMEHPDAGWFSWVMDDKTLLGVNIQPDGGLRLGAGQDRPEYAMFSGLRALVPDSSGYASETIDGARTWRRVPLPLNVASVTPSQAGGTSCQFGCSTVGCRLGAWLRLGWSHSSSVTSLDSLEPPASLVLERRNRRLQTLRCVRQPIAPSVPKGSAPRGETESLRRGGGRSSNRGVTEELESTAWYPLYGVTPPRPSSGQIGFDRAFEDQRFALHAYLSSPRAMPSSGMGQMSLLVVDQLGSGVPWVSRTNRAPFANREVAARAFGHPRYGLSASRWEVIFDSGGEAGLMVMAEGSQTYALLFEANRPLSELPALLDRTPRHITDLIRTRDAWYLLGTEPEPRLFEVRGSGVRILADADPRARLGRAHLALVRDSEGNRLAYLTRTARVRSADVEWLLYPIDRASGRIQAPYRIPWEQGLRRCELDETGWLVSAELESMVDFELPELSGSTPRVMGKLMLSSSGICVERLLVVPRGGPVVLAPVPSQSALTAPFPGVLVDGEGRRHTLRCSLP